MEIAAEKDNLELLIERELFPDAFRSSLMEDGIAAGKDLLSRTMPFENGAVLNPVGMINVADSMAAVKRLVYEDKKVAMGDLKRALDLDWQGCEDLRKMCLDAPKYGNGDSYVDEIAADLYEFWAATANELADGVWKHAQGNCDIHYLASAWRRIDGRYTGRKTCARNLCGRNRLPDARAGHPRPDGRHAQRFADRPGSVPGHPDEHEVSSFRAAERRRFAKAFRDDKDLPQARREACAV